MTDLNNDGMNDLILSDAYGFGNGGGPWTAYVHTNGGWVAIGDPAFRYGMFAMEKTVDDEVRLWYYSHLSCSDGYIGYFQFSGGGMDDKPQRMLIDTGDTGTPIGNAIVEAVFKTKSNHPYRFEHSATTNGVVTWSEVKR